MESAPTLATAVPTGASVYVLTVSPDGRPHVAPTSAVVRDAAVVVLGVPGRRTRAHVAAGSPVTVLWSPADRADHTLILDGTSAEADGALVVRATRAVLHRASEEPAAPAADGACTADCVEVALR